MVLWPYFRSSKVFDLTGQYSLSVIDPKTIEIEMQSSKLDTPLVMFPVTCQSPKTEIDTLTGPSCEKQPKVTPSGHASNHHRRNGTWEKADRNLRPAEIEERRRARTHVRLQHATRRRIGHLSSRGSGLFDRCIFETHSNSSSPVNRQRGGTTNMHFLSIGVRIYSGAPNFGRMPSGGVFRPN